MFTGRRRRSGAQSAAHIALRVTLQVWVLNMEWLYGYGVTYKLLYSYSTSPKQIRSTGSTSVTTATATHMSPSP